MRYTGCLRECSEPVLKCELLRLSVLDQLGLPGLAAKRVWSPTHPLLIGQDPRAFEIRLLDMIRGWRQGQDGITAKATTGMSPDHSPYPSQ